VTRHQHDHHCLSVIFRIKNEQQNARADQDRNSDMRGAEYFGLVLLKHTLQDSKQPQTLRVLDVLMNECQIIMHELILSLKHAKSICSIDGYYYLRDARGACNN
jgi:hypothetical protein